MYPEDAKLELVSKGGGANQATRGFITIRLSTGDVAQMGALALSNARQDVEHRRIMQPDAATQPQPVQSTGAAGRGFRGAAGSRDARKRTAESDSRGESLAGRRVLYCEFAGTV